MEAADCNKVTETSAAELNTIGNIVKVSCIATLNNCPDETLDKVHSDGIRKFLFHEKHVLDNVKSSRLDHLSSRSFRNKLFVHTISVTLSVKTARIQEDAGSYVKNYIGNQSWSLENGMELRLAQN